MSGSRYEGLQPTLWRTCRALANKTRLRILQHVFLHPGEHVSGIARRLDMPVSVTSEYLRMLEARGILECRRAGRWVRHSLSTGNSPHVALLVAAIIETFKTHKDPTSFIRFTATAFTHPQRVKIAEELWLGPLKRAELRRRIGMSDAAMTRHLRKLRKRGFILTTREVCRLVPQDYPFPRALLTLAQRK